MFTKQQVNAAAHTLWQVAVGSGGVGEILKSVTDHSVNVPGLEQGLFVAGAAVGGAALSLVKSFVVNYSKTHKASVAVHDAEKVAQLAAAVAAYQSKHAATALPGAVTPVQPTQVLSLLPNIPA